MPTTVATSTSNMATFYPFQRKCFYAKGLHWVFFGDGEYMAYATSSDGVTWSSPTQVRTVEEGSGREFSIWFDGIYVHYAVHKDRSEYNPRTGTTTTYYEIYYRRGTPNSDGTITWGTEYKAHSSTSTCYRYPMIAVDSGGYPWIGLFYAAQNYAVVTKSSTNDGTWTTASGFPYTLTTTTSPWRVTVVPLSNLKTYIIYAAGGLPVRGRLWDGSSMGSEESATASDIQSGNAYSAVAEGDDVHLVFLVETSYDIAYVKRTYGVGWSSETTVQTSADQYSQPVLSINTTNNNLYCFWAGSPSSNHIYYKKCVSGTWDASPTDWIAEETTLTDNDRLSSFYQVYSGKIGVTYMTGTSSPYNVRYAFLVVAVPVIAKRMLGDGLVWVVT